MKLAETHPDEVIWSAIQADVLGSEAEDRKAIEVLEGKIAAIRAQVVPQLIITSYQEQ